MDDKKKKEWLRAEELIEVYEDIFNAEDKLGIDPLCTVANLYATRKICKEDFLTLIDYLKD